MAAAAHRRSQFALPVDANILHALPALSRFPSMRIASDWKTPRFLVPANPTAKCWHDRRVPPISKVHKLGK